MGGIEEWARKWLEDQRHEGKTCLEIKMRGSKYYVYHSTNRYDKEIKKGRKVSKYLGKLDKEKGFIPKGENKRAVAGPRNITEYGNSMLLHEMLKDIKPRLKEVFPDHWEEICVLLRSVFDKPFFKRFYGGSFWQCSIKTGERCMGKALQCRRY